MENVEENEEKWIRERGKWETIEKNEKWNENQKFKGKKGREKAEDLYLFLFLFVFWFVCLFVCLFFLAFHFQETTETFKGSTKMGISTGKKPKISPRKKSGKVTLVPLKIFLLHN